MSVKEILHHHWRLVVFLDGLHHVVGKRLNLLPIAGAAGRLELLIVRELLRMRHLLRLRVRILLRAVIFR